MGTFYICVDIEYIDSMVLYPDVLACRIVFVIRIISHHLNELIDVKSFSDFLVYLQKIYIVWKLPTHTHYTLHLKLILFHFNHDIYRSIYLSIYLCACKRMCLWVYWCAHNYLMWKTWKKTKGITCEKLTLLHIATFWKISLSNFFSLKFG